MPYHIPSCMAPRSMPLYNGFLRGEWWHSAVCLCRPYDDRAESWVSSAAELQSCWEHLCAHPAVQDVAMLVG
jgi:hypothetical protein